MSLFAAALAALAVLLAGPVGSGRSSSRDLSTAPAAVVQEAWLRRLRLPLVALAMVGAWVFLGGALGVLAGLGVGTFGWRVLGSVEHPVVAGRRRDLERDLPLAVHLLGAALAAGSAVVSALADVADALPGPVAEELGLARARLQLGIDPVTSWRAMDGALQPLGRTMARAHESGASVSAAVARLAEDLRLQRRLRTEELARSVEVRAAAPLGLCFLPAFVVLGVVPMVAGIFSGMPLLG